MSDPLVQVAALQTVIGAPGVRILDATWFMPDSGRDAAREYAQAHLPGAIHFDIDAIADLASPLPHMLAAPEAFADAVGRLGVASDDRVVVYDRKPIASAPRVWWSLRAMGHDDVQVLDGGLDAWLAAGGAIESGGVTAPAARFIARRPPELVSDFAGVSTALGDGSAQLVDARPAARFRGEAPEPRAGLRSGHAPGARNTPSSSFYETDGRLLGPPALRELLDAAGVAADRPLIATCGSGITASVVALALARLGRWDTSVYDGSWAEWGGRADAPVVAGA